MLSAEELAIARHLLDGLLLFEARATKAGGEASALVTRIRDEAAALAAEERRRVDAPSVPHQVGWGEKA